MGWDGASRNSITRARHPLLGWVTVAALFLLSFAVAAGNGAIFALLPQIQEAAHLPTWSLGLVVGSSFGAGLVSQLALARFADRGHARLMLLVGACVAALGYIGVGYGWGLGSVVAGRAVAGLGIGMVYPAGRKLLVARHPDRAGQMLGYFLACDVAGFVLGAPIGAGLAALGGVGVAFSVLAAIIVLCAVPVARLRLEISAESIQAARAERSVLRNLLRRRRLRAGLALGAATFWAIGVFDTVWARYLTDLGSSTWFIAVSLTCFGLPMAALAGFGGRVSDRYGPLPVGLVAGVAVVPFVVAYGQVASPSGLIAVSVIHAMIDAVNMPAAQACVVAECAEHEVAAGQGLLSAMQLSTAAISALAVAPIYQRYGAGACFTIAGVVMVAALAVALHQSLPQRGSAAPAQAPAPPAAAARSVR